MYITDSITFQRQGSLYTQPPLNCLIDHFQYLATINCEAISQHFHHNFTARPYLYSHTEGFIWNFLSIQFKSLTNFDHMTKPCPMWSKQWASITIVFHWATLRWTTWQNHNQGTWETSWWCKDMYMGVWKWAQKQLPISPCDSKAVFLYSKHFPKHCICDRYILLPPFAYSPWCNSACRWSTTDVWCLWQQTHAPYSPPQYSYNLAPFPDTTRINHYISHLFYIILRTCCSMDVG